MLRSVHFQTWDQHFLLCGSGKRNSDIGKIRHISTVVLGTGKNYVTIRLPGAKTVFSSPVLNIHGADTSIWATSILPVSDDGTGEEYKILFNKEFQNNISLRVNVFYYAE